MRTPFIAGNWKMYKTVAETVKYVKEFRALVKDIADVEIVVAPPFTALARRGRGGAQQQRRRSPRRICYWEREGAFTGEVSAPMIREAGAEYVIIGHSERRTLFGETDATVNRKIARGVRGRPDADRLHRRDARSARAQRDVRGARPADQAGARRPDRASSSRSW